MRHDNYLTHWHFAAFHVCTSQYHDDLTLLTCSGTIHVLEPKMRAVSDSLPVANKAITVSFCEWQ